MVYVAYENYSFVIRENTGSTRILAGLIIEGTSNASHVSFTDILTAINEYVANHDTYEAINPLWIGTTYYSSEPTGASSGYVCVWEEYSVGDSSSRSNALNKIRSSMNQYRKAAGVAASEGGKPYAKDYFTNCLPQTQQLSTPSLSISCDDAVLATITETESATTFHLEYRVSGASTWSEYTGHIVSADSNVEVVDITDLLTGGTVYEFRAYCSDSSGEYEDSDYSEIVSFKLFSKVAYKGVKSRTTSAISFYTTNLGLTSGTTWIAQYKKRGTDTWLTATTSNSSQLTVSASGLTADSVYDFRIRLTRSEGESTWFYVAQTTRSNQTAPAPTCTVGSTTIAATWTPPTGYNWYQLSATLNGTVVARNGWTQETSGTLTGLTPGTTYTARVQYRITAEGDAYENDSFRGTVDVTTLSQLDTPTDLTATNVTHNSADLGWNNVENASNYRVDYRIYGDTLWQQTTSN